MRESYPTRVACQFQQQAGQVALDQLRAVDTVRRRQRLGTLDEATSRAVCTVLVEMFAW